MLVKNVNHETRAEASYLLEEPYKGSSTLTVKNLPLLKDIYSKATFDVGTKNKQVKVWNT